MPVTSEALRIGLRVNARDVVVTVRAEDSLLDVLRDQLRLDGCRRTCGMGLCGACTVVLDGRAVNSCITPAFPLDGVVVTTVEGLGTEGRLSALQQAFVDRQAFQCAFCTSGFLMSAAAALDDDSAPLDIDRVIEGHLCRCGSYPQIEEALRDVAESGSERSRCGRSRGGEDGSRDL